MRRDDIQRQMKDLYDLLGRRAEAVDPGPARSRALGGQHALIALCLAMQIQGDRYFIKRPAEAAAWDPRRVLDPALHLSDPETDPEAADAAD